LRGSTIRTVVAVTADAAAGGARAGMSATEAATRVPDLVARLEDPVAERAAAGALLDAAWATSPRVEVVEPGSLCLDLGGLAPLFGDERRIGERLIAAGAAVGPPVRLQALARGTDLGPFVAHLEPEPCREAITLDWEVPSLPALAFILDRLLAQLAARLALREAGAAALHLSLRLADGG